MDQGHERGSFRPCLIPAERCSDAAEARQRSSITGPASLKAYDEAKAQSRGGNDWSDIYNVVGEGTKKG